MVLRIRLIRRLNRLPPLLICVDICVTLCVMATNLNISDSLIKKAQELGQHKTKREAVTTALEEYVRRHAQMKVLESFGKVDFDSKYDYKRQRKKT